jgi:hypothetical protein
MFGGCANDVIFMYLVPVVDNFWHAQAALMITPRLPLYILCLYNCFIYIPITFLWWYSPSLYQSSRVTFSCAAGLLAIAFYAPFDAVGAKFLWWTWHDTDTGISSRILGAPVGSSCWVCIFTACFAFLFQQASRKLHWPVLARLIYICVFSVPAMMVHMMILQSFADFKLVFGLIPVPGMPPYPPLNKYIFAAVVIIYSLICAPALLIHAPTSSTIFPELNAHSTKKG